MLKLRLKLLGRMLTLSATPEGRRNVLVAGLFALFVVLTSRISTELFDTLRLTPEIGTALVFRVVAIAQLSFAMMLIFSSLVAGALILFSNPENDLMYSLPIPTVKLFAVRFLEAMGATGWMVFLFGIPMAVGLGRSFIAGWDYAVLAALALLGLIILPTAIGITVLCAVFALLPKHRLKALGIGLALLGSYFAVDTAAKVDIGALFKMEFDPGLHLDAVLKTIEIPSHPYTPDTLSAQAMAAMVRGETSQAWKILGWLWAESLAGLLALMGLAYPLFLKGWTHQSQAEIDAGRFPAFDRPVFRRSPFLSLCLKDLKFLYRDIVEWSQMLVLLTLILVHIVNIRDLPLDQAYLVNFVSFVNLMVSGLLVVAVSVRFVYPTFSLEGDSAYLLKTLPLKTSLILRSKFCTYAFLLLVLSQAILFISNRQTHVSAFFSVFSHFVCAVQTLTIAALALGSALLMPPQTGSSLERAAGSTGGLLFMILGSLYIVATVAYFSAPIYKQMLITPLSGEYLEPILTLAAAYTLAHLAGYLFCARFSTNMLNRI